MKMIISFPNELIIHIFSFQEDFWVTKNLKQIINIQKLSQIPRPIHYADASLVKLTILNRKYHICYMNNNGREFFFTVLQEVSTLKSLLFYSNDRVEWI